MNPLHSKHVLSSAFTLIELLVVIAIIAILAVVVVLTLNPTQLLAQSRDSNRVSDMATLNTALGLYQTDQSGIGSLGTANVIYASLPDASSTCSHQSLLTLPVGYSYNCASSTNYRNASSSGWIPVNFQNISAGAPFGSLPVDPTNSSSSRLYYTYTTNGSTYELTTAMESTKYKAGGTGDVVTSDGAPLASLYAKGTNLALEPLDYGDASLVGYWPMNEGSGGIANDNSGNNAPGVLVGAPTWGSGKIGSGSLVFSSTTSQYVSVSSAFHPINSISVTTWVKKIIGATGNGAVIVRNNNDYFMDFANGASVLRFGFNSNWSQQASGYPDDGNWHFVAGTYNGSVISYYVDGVSIGQNPYNVAVTNSGFGMYIGGFQSYASLNGSLDDVRIYNRALSAAEIQALYNAGK